MIRTIRKPVLVFMLMAVLTACQPERTSAPDQKPSESAMLIASIATMDLPQAKFCDATQCTRYRIDMVQTNLAWINQYFLDWVKQHYPEAFQTQSNTAQQQTFEQANNHAIAVTIRYLGQHETRVSFVIEQSHYRSDGTANIDPQYVHFDIEKKTKIGLKELMQPHQQAAILERLVQYNQPILQQHTISAEQLELTDNFVFQQEGIVWINPLPDTVKMQQPLQLILPYTDSAEFLQSTYIPSTLNFTLEE